MPSRRSQPIKRLGRPPATDSADTRRRILDVARAAFAERGYDWATNRDLAAGAGLTSGALYHYFGSKLDLYVAVHNDLQELVYGQFNEAIEDAEGFVGKFEAVLDAAHELNEHDPSLAAFLGVVRTDMQRHPEIRELLGEHADRRDQFFVRLVDAGIESGEVRPENRQYLIEFVSMILIGLTDGLSDDPLRHERAVTAIKLALHGDLITPPLSSVVSSRSTPN
jgi:AcrR family transcriptional regulator